jgi:hypothetical protein
MIKKIFLHENSYPQKLDQWIKKINHFFPDSNSNLQIETSIKIGKERINTHRYSIFLKNINPNDAKNILEKINVPVHSREKIENDMKNSPFHEMIYGVDLSCHCGRIYLSLSTKEVKAWEWLDHRIFIKKYYHVEKMELVFNYLQEYFSSKELEYFFQCAPFELWEYACIKSDIREGSHPCSFYVSLEHAPTISQIRPYLEDLFFFFHGKKNKKIIDWLNCFSSCSIFWFALTKKKEKNEIAVYVNSKNFIMDYLESYWFANAYLDLLPKKENQKYLASFSS